MKNFIYNNLNDDDRSGQVSRNYFFLSGNSSCSLCNLKLSFLKNTLRNFVVLLSFIIIKNKLKVLFNLGH